MIRKSLLSLAVVCSAYACSGAPVTLGNGEGGAEGGTLDSGPSPDGFGVDASPCSGANPRCYDNNPLQCCSTASSVAATCSAGTWTCGGGKVVGCNGTADCADASPSCSGSAPDCFGDDDSQCCGQDPSGLATCVGGAWTCGSVPAPGCDGTKCILPVDGGPSDVISFDVTPPFDVISFDGGPFDVISIDASPPPDSGFDAGPVPDGSSACGPKFCTSGDTCVITTSSGGPCLIVPDSGVCPAGMKKEGGCCVFYSVKYKCSPTPTACGGTPSCACATSLCGSCSCTGAIGDDLECGCFFP